MSRRRIDGLPGWFRQDGKIYERVTEKVDVGLWTEDKSVGALAKMLTVFADTHTDTAVFIEHSSYADGDYSCETHLELIGDIERSEDELAKARDKMRRRQRSDALARERALRDQLERVRRELGE